MNHTLSVHVENKPGVLARVSSLLARRGFNIHSLAVGPSHEPGMSRMTIVVEAPELEQVKKQLHKLVNVVKISELAPAQAIERELALIRVHAPAGKRTEILELASLFDAEAIDVGQQSLAFQVIGTPEHIEDFVELVGTHGLTDLVKSGSIAMAKEQKRRSRSNQLRAV